MARPRKHDVPGGVNIPPELARALLDGLTHTNVVRAQAGKAPLSFRAYVLDVLGRAAVEASATPPQAQAAA